MGRCLSLTRTPHHLVRAVVSRNAPSLPLRPHQDLLWCWDDEDEDQDGVSMWHIYALKEEATHVRAAWRSPAVQRQGKCVLIKALEKHNPQ